MRIVMVRSLKGYPDSRVEKELYSLSKKNKIIFFGWNRHDNKKKISHEVVKVFGKPINYYHFNKYAPIGLGFKKLFFPLLKYWHAEYRFLKNNRENYDAIHACDFDTILPALKIAKKYNKKLVYDIFDYYSEAHNGPKIIKKIIKKLEDNAISKADVTIICSDARKMQIKDSKPNRLYVIHNTPMDMKDLKISRKLIVDSTKIQMVYIGLLSEDRYLREMAKVIQKRNDIVWHVGGWGPLESYFSDLANINSNIIFYGEVGYETALEIEKQCDIMTALYDPAVPNHKYSAPNKFYESLMLGKPLIMIKGTGMDEYVTKFNIGEVIDLKSTDFLNGFENAINNIIDKGNISEISYRARDIYEEMFSWSKMEDRLLDVYESIN